MINWLDPYFGIEIPAFALNCTVKNASDKKPAASRSERDVFPEVWQGAHKNAPIFFDLALLHRVEENRVTPFALRISPCQSSFAHTAVYFA